jgi:hypothetical protein
VITVKTDGTVTHVYIGGRQINADANGKFDPVAVAAAELRVDCRNDLEKLLRPLRRNAWAGLKGRA